MKPWRDSEYLRWIRTLPCVVCGTTRYVEAAHTGPHGLGQKSADSTAVPLCPRHHRTGNDSYHKLGIRRFADVHSLRLHEIVNSLNVKPRIQVVDRAFIGWVNDDSFLLGPVEGGLCPAVRKMIVLRRLIVRQDLEEMGCRRAR